MAVAMTEEMSVSLQKNLADWWSEETDYVFQRIERWAALARGYNRLRSQRLSRGRLTMQEEQEPRWTIAANRLVIDDPTWAPRFRDLKKTHRRKSRTDENCRINCCGSGFDYRSNGSLDSACLESYRYDHSIYFKTIGDIRSSRKSSEAGGSESNSRFEDERLEWDAKTDSGKLDSGSNFLDTVKSNSGDRVSGSNFLNNAGSNERLEWEVKIDSGNLDSGSNFLNNVKTNSGNLDSGSKFLNNVKINSGNLDSGSNFLNNAASNERLEFEVKTDSGNLDLGSNLLKNVKINSGNLVSGFNFLNNDDEEAEEEDDDDDDDEDDGQFDELARENGNFRFRVPEFRRDVDEDDEAERVANAWPIVDLARLSLEAAGSDEDNNNNNDNNDNSGSNDNGDYEDCKSGDPIRKVIQLQIAEFANSCSSNNVGSDSTMLSPLRNSRNARDESRASSFRKQRRSPRRVKQPTLSGDNNVVWPSVLLNYTKNIDPATSPHHRHVVDVK